MPSKSPYEAMEEERKTELEGFVNPIVEKKSSVKKSETKQDKPVTDTQAKKKEKPSPPKEEPVKESSDEKKKTKPLSATISAEQYEFLEIMAKYCTKSNVSKYLSTIIEDHMKKKTISEDYIKYKKLDELSPDKIFELLSSL